MKLRTIYNDVRLLLEKNRTNNNLYLSEDRFVLYFNLVKDKIQSYYLEKRNEDAIRMMAPFLITNSDLDLVEKDEISSTFEIPDNYFDFSNLLVFASKSSCKNEQILAHEIKSENLHQYINNENLEPSFFYRETFYIISSKGIQIFTKNDFDVPNVKLTYYRKIGEVDLSGYIKEDGTPSTDIDTDIPDNLIPIFVNSIVKAFSESEGDVNRYQIANNNLVSPL